MRKWNNLWFTRYFIIKSIFQIIFFSKAFEMIRDITEKLI